MTSIVPRLSGIARKYKRAICMFQEIERILPRLVNLKNTLKAVGVDSVTVYRQ